MKKQQKKNAKGKAGEKPAAPKKAEYRAFTMADYRAMEKVAKSIETACRIRRKYVMAMQTARAELDRFANIMAKREIKSTLRRTPTLLAAREYCNLADAADWHGGR